MAIEESVDFVIIAGDLFDGKWRDMNTGLWMAEQFRRLLQAGNRNGGIPVYIARGNHDAESEVRDSVTWPENVFEFSTRRPETFVIEHLDTALHGQGFSSRKMPDDLTGDYPDPIDGMFNIGVLHTSLTGNSAHDTYAPTSAERLVACGYDYWALGHIHRRERVRESSPVIAFPGNIQGRHINEPGAKGCLLVSVENARVESVDFRATDVARWFRVDIGLDADDGRGELIEKVRQRLRQCLDQNDGRLAAVRLGVGGRSMLHEELTRHESREELIAEIRNVANELDNDVWLEQIDFDTAPPIDRDKLRAGNDLLGELLRDIDRLADDNDRLEQAAECLADLIKKAPGELQRADVDPQDPQTLRRWLHRAEGLLLAHLSEVDSE